MYEEEIDPEDTAVYCICQKPYAEEDDEVLMIACDA
jgi:COMPASS component SPP1